MRKEAKRTRSRIIAFLLTVCMTFSLMPTAFAASAADFADVPSTAWYYDSVDYVVQHKYFEGTGRNTFSPATPMNRAMFVTVLARLDGAEVDDTDSAFDDVASGSWYAGAVAWAVENRIANGVGDNKFAPTQSVTRQEMAAFMSRYIAYYTAKNNVTFSAGSAKTFTDADRISSYAKAAVTLCSSYGLIDGYTDGSFGADDTATRAQVAAVIGRLAALLENAGPAAQEEAHAKTGTAGETTSDKTASSAEDFKAAAEVGADRVTATVTQKNTLSVYDDVVITNNTAKELTLDLSSANLGDLTVNSESAETITIEGDSASVYSLTIDAPLATVKNYVTVNGTITIKAVSGSTFDNYASTGTIIMNGSGAVNDQRTQPAPVVIDVPKGTTVTVKGNSAQISVVSDGAQLTVATKVAPKVECTAQKVELTVDTTETVTVAGTVDTVKTAVTAPTLKVDGTVRTVDTASASEVKVEGTGAIGTVNSGSAAVVVESSRLSVETVAAADGGSLKAPANTVSEVRASGSVTLNAAVGTVTAENDTVLTLSENASVTTVEAQGSVTIDGTGTVSSIDVQTDNAQIAVSESAQITVEQVTTTADNTENITVTVPNQTIRVLTKAAKPENILASAPGTLDGNGTITGVDTTMEYSSMSDDLGWLEVTETALSLPAGTYQVRVKEQGARLASEAVTVTIPATVGVDSVTVQGTLHVGQTLTAAANSDATGTISYEWKLGDTVVGTAKTLTLADAYTGQTLSVTISNYGGAASSTTTVGTVIVDKTALGKLLGKAAEIQKGVSVKDEEASAVAEGIVFVATEQSDALTAAIDAGNAALADTANTATVSKAEDTLREKIAAYTAAKKTGTNNDVRTLQNDLIALLTDAPQVVPTAESAESVTPGEQWTTAAAKTAFTTAWSTANGKTASTDAATLRQAISDLNNAITAYTKAIQLGEQLDGSALAAAMTAAEQNAASVKVSVNGTDILPGETWVPQAALDAYKDAITAAKTVTAAVQNDYTQALVTLNNKTDNFNSAKNAGSKAEHVHTFTIVTNWQTLTTAKQCACGESQLIENTYYITSAADLAAFRDAVNAGTDFAGTTVTLMADITLEGEWTPIGQKAGNMFRGTFDGNYKTVSGLNITENIVKPGDNGTENGSPFEGYGAFFGAIDGKAVVRNLTVSGTVNCANAAGIVARMNAGTVEDCTSNVTVTGTKKAGGIVCLTNSGGCTIRSCINNGTVSGTTTGGIGGIVGYANNNTSIESCRNLGAIGSAQDKYSGGIVGYATGADVITVEACENSADISAHTGAGGIVGNVTAAATVESCTNNGAVYGNAGSAGGIAGGIAKATLVSCTNTAAVNGCYAGGVAGTAGASTIENCSGGKAAISSESGVTGRILAVASAGHGTPELWTTLKLDDANADDHGMATVGALGYIGGTGISNLKVQSGTLYGAPARKSASACKIEIDTNARWLIGEIELDAGTYSATLDEQGRTEYAAYDENGKITGGLFYSDPSERLAGDYVAKNSSDVSSIWTVSRKIWSDYPADPADVSQMPSGVKITSLGDEHNKFEILLEDEEAFLYFTQVFDCDAAQKARQTALENKTVTRYPNEYDGQYNMWWGAYTGGITVKMGCDVDLKGMTVSTVKFGGSYGPNFDGDGHTISNAKMEASSGDIGFFNGNISVSNVTFDNFTVSATGCETAAVVVGYPTGAVSNAAITNVTVKNCSVTGGRYAGAIAGHLYGADVEDCRVEKTIVCGQYKVGGIAGQTSQGGITDCALSNVTVRGDNIVSGKTEFVIGKVIGCWATNGGYCTNNTFTDGTTEATANIGKVYQGYTAPQE